MPIHPGVADFAGLANLPRAGTLPASEDEEWVTHPGPTAEELSPVPDGEQQATASLASAIHRLMPPAAPAAASELVMPNKFQAGISKSRAPTALPLPKNRAKPENALEDPYGGSLEDVTMTLAFSVGEIQLPRDHAHFFCQAADRLPQLCTLLARRRRLIQQRLKSSLAR